MTQFKLHPPNTGIYVTFLKRGSIQKIEDKEVNVVGRDVVSGTVLVDNSNYSRSFIPGTQWNIVYSKQIMIYNSDNSIISDETESFFAE